MTGIKADVDAITASREEAAKSKRNVYQRKLAVMARCDVIKPDSKYDAPTKSGSRVRFDYNSIQAISNHIRSFCVEEGLDVTCSATGSLVHVVMTNVDKLDEQIEATWPMVPDDKAWAYSTKFALIRTFLIGDGTEGDEAELATRSGARPATNGHTEAPATLPPAGRKAGSSGPLFRTAALDETGVSRRCPDCGGGMEAILWDSGKVRVECENWKECGHKENASVPLTVAVIRQAEMSGAVPSKGPGAIPGSDLF